MYATAGWCGGRADVEAFIGRGIGCWRNGWACEHLREVLHASIDITADVVGVVALHLHRAGGMPGQDTFAKAGGEALNLGLDALAHIDGRAVGDVAVCPHCLFASRGAGVIEEALLREQDERLFGMLSTPDRAFGSCDFFECSATLDGSGSPARLGSAGNGAVEPQVELEDARPVTVVRELAFIESIDAFPGDAHKLAPRHVTEHEPGW